MTKRSTVLLVVTALALVLAGCFGPAPKKLSNVAGTILDTAGQPVEGARVRIANLETLTDADGNFSLKDVPQGVHTMNVYVQGVLEYTGEVETRKEQVLLGEVQLYENLIENPAFLMDDGDPIPPPPWKMYSNVSYGHLMYFVDEDDPETRALVLEDKVSGSGNSAEIGVEQTVAGATPGNLYRANVRAGTVPGKVGEKYYLQIRFLKSNSNIGSKQIDIIPTVTEGFEDFSVELEAPAEAEAVRVYIYTPQSGMPVARVHSVSLWDLGPAN